MRRWVHKEQRERSGCGDTLQHPRGRGDPQRQSVTGEILAVAVGFRRGHGCHHGCAEADARAHGEADQQSNEQPAD